MSKKSFVKYLKSGAEVCPVCGHRKVMADLPQPTESNIVAYAENGCSKCDAVWEEAWVLAGIVNIRDGETGRKLSRDSKLNAREMVKACEHAVAIVSKEGKERNDLRRN